ncbi:hypothetical protein AAC387_Pa11g0528 [Persea americana]
MSLIFPSLWCSRRPSAVDSGSGGQSTFGTSKGAAEFGACGCLDKRCFVCMMDRRRFPSGILESSILEILSLVKPTEDDRQKRLHIINEFRAVVQSVESLRGALVEPFGSFVSNLYTRWGDLDISVDVPNGSLVPSVGKRRKQTLLRDIMRALRRNGVYSLEFIPNARVPLLIYQGNYRNTSCDISICNLLGQIKSKFMLWITEIDERFRDMVLLIKEWAKAKAINDPKNGTLNSYSLCLLVIFHFQTCNPSILPPLKDIYVGNIADDLTGTRLIVERRIQDTCAANIARFKYQRFHQVNQSSLSELFVTFFEKFSREEFLSNQYAICTYSGRLESITSQEKWMQKNHKILIEDPFEMPDNAARAVSMNGLERISGAFEETNRMLSSRTVDRNHLMTSLVRPHIRPSIGVRTPHINSRIGARAPQDTFNTPTRVSHPVVTPIHERFTQVMQLQSRPSSSTVSVQGHGAVQTVQRQGRKQWRPRPNNF